MKYKQAGMIGAALSLALTSLAYNQVVNTSTLQSSDPQPSTSQPSNPQSSDPQPSDPQPSDPQLSKPSAVVPDASLSYQIETYNSQVLGGSRTYGVVLPAAYELSPTQRYPVVFLLHGGHGSPTSWLEKEKGAALETLQQLSTAGKLPPSIIITPDGNDKRGSSPYWDPQYIDGPNGKVAEAIGDELVKVIQSRYRTLPTPDFWAIGGLSSGAWGAINVGLHYRNHFSILFSHSGYFQDKSGPQNSPMSFIKTISPQERQRLRIYLDTGKEDRLFLNQNRQFHQVLDQLEIMNVLHEFPGKHTWRYWRQHLADSLTFVGEQFQQTQNFDGKKRPQ